MGWSYQCEEVVALEVSKKRLTRFSKITKALQNVKEAGMKQMKEHGDKTLNSAQKRQDERIKTAEVAKRRLEKGAELNKLEELASGCRWGPRMRSHRVLVLDDEAGREWTGKKDCNG